MQNLELNDNENLEVSVDWQNLNKLEEIDNQLCGYVYLLKLISADIAENDTTNENICLFDIATKNIENLHSNLINLEQDLKNACIA